ncbi:MAG: metallophosphoesterase [Bacteroidales bacterium]
MLITRRTFIRTAAAAGIGAVAGTGAYGVAYERHRFEVTHTPVALPTLDRAFDGLRIGILTDLHHSRLVSQDDIARAAGLLMAERPDVVVLLGDYVTWSDRRYLDSCGEALSGVSAPRGMLAIVGNHDEERATQRVLARAGFDVLTDERTTIRIGGAGLVVAGLRYWTRRPAEIERVLGHRGQTAILLAHDPRRLTEAARFGVPLVLSGHTHGGQIVLPLLGAIAATKFPIASGVARLGDTAVFVSRGIGTVFVPMRLNCAPEVAIVTLRSQSSA